MHARTTHPTGTPQQDRRGWSRWHMTWSVAIVAALGLALISSLPVQAETFHCSAGDVSCLIAAISEANASGKKNEIRLEAGVYALVAVDNITHGPNGLPSILGELTIQGAGPEDTIIERASSTFRLVHVAATGNLTLDGVTLRRGGGLGFSGGGAAVFNEGGTMTITNSSLIGNTAPNVGGVYNNGGILTIANSTLSHNSAFFAVGGILNAGGTVTIISSALADHHAQNSGAISNGGTLTITNSTLVSNQATDPGYGGAISNSGTLTIVNSTLSHNSAALHGGAISNSGPLTIINSTLSGNAACCRGGASGGGIYGSGVLQNTILALNTTNATFPTPSDCVGSITSLGNNLIGDLTGCTITLQPTDLTGNPGLDEFIDEGLPGTGYFPLLPTSRAIDAGNEAACPKTDQLGEHRDKPCDIGAIEFQGTAVSSR